MGRPASGLLATDRNGMAIARITLKSGVPRVSIRLHRPIDDAGVCDRLAHHVITHARELFQGGQLSRTEVRDALDGATLKAGECRTVDQLDRYWELVVSRQLVVKAARRDRPHTYAEVAEQWLSGEIARKHKGIEMRSSHGVDQARGKLTTYVFPLIGHIPIDQVTAAHLGEVYDGACKHMRATTAVNLWDIARRVVSLAAEPLKLIERSPITKHDRPEAVGRAHAALEPQDDLDLMRCTAVSPHDRMWFGFLAREGTRVNELAALKWSALSPTSNILTVYMFKTKQYTKWMLSAETADALRAYRVACGNPPNDAPMFRPTHGMKVQARWYRTCLKLAGVCERRPELWVHDDDNGQVRAHDLRALMVTIALAAGKPDSHIRQRTGHKSERMIRVYNRDADLYREAGFTSLTPLMEAIPELAAGVAMPPDAPRKTGRPRKHPPKATRAARTVKPSKAAKYLAIGANIINMGKSEQVLQ